MKFLTRGEIRRVINCTRNFIQIIEEGVKERKTFFIEQEVLYRAGVTPVENGLFHVHTSSFCCLLFSEPRFRFPCGELVSFRAVREFKFDVERTLRISVRELVSRCATTLLGRRKKILTVAVYPRGNLIAIVPPPSFSKTGGGVSLPRRESSIQREEKFLCSLERLGASYGCLTVLVFFQLDQIWTCSI